MGLKIDNKLTFEVHLQSFGKYEQLDTKRFSKNCMFVKI